MSFIQNMRVTTPVNTYIGPGSSRIVGPLLQNRGIDKVLVICDRNIETAGLLSDILESLRSAGCSIAVCSDIPTDPPDTVIDRVSALGWERRCQAVVAVGGGSCMDAGKCVAFLQRNPGRIRDYLTTPALPRRKGVPLVVIPTTAGTGSEVTFGVVVTDSESGRKIGAKGVEFLAAIGLIDPVLTLGLPPAVTASTAMDAFAHAVEAMLSGEVNPNCRLFALEAVRLISDNLEHVLADGRDVQRRQEMMYAAYLAGMALNDGSCNLGHALAHVLGGRYHIPHGEACAITIPMTIEYFAPIFPQRLRDLGRNMEIPLPRHLSAQETGRCVADAVRSLNRRIGIRTMAELGVPYGDLPGIAEQALKENIHSMLRPAIMRRKVGMEDLLRPMEKEYRGAPNPPGVPFPAETK